MKRYECRFTSLLNNTSQYFFLIYCNLWASQALATALRTISLPSGMERLTDPGHKGDPGYCWGAVRRRAPEEAVNIASKNAILSTRWGIWVEPGGTQAGEWRKVRKWEGIPQPKERERKSRAEGGEEPGDPPAPVLPPAGRLGEIGRRAGESL